MFKYSTTFLVTDSHRGVFIFSYFTIFCNHCEVVKIETKNLNSKILERFDKLEQVVTDSLQELEDKLNMGEETFLLFNNGLKAYKERHLYDVKVSDSNIVLNKLSEKFRNDKELRYPHRKILEFLLSQYDFDKSEFNEVYFSQLVKEAHLGKNMADSYLSLLKQKSYIQKRTDGYRTYFKIMG